MLPLEIGVNLDSDRLKTITQAVSEHMRFSAERARFSAEQAHVNTTRLLIGQRASYNRFFHWLFPDANDGSNDLPKDHRSFPNMKLPTAAIIMMGCEGLTSV